MLAYLSCHRGCTPPPDGPAVAIDAKARQHDPTETSGLRVRMRAEGRKRWQNFARTLRQGLVEHDVVGLRGVGRLPHGDKTEGFAAWIAGELAHKVFAQGLWLKPYIRKAAGIAQEQSRKRVLPAATIDPSRVRAIESLAVAELKGIVEAAQQQLVRAATHRMMANHSPYKIANALAVVVRSMSRRTDALVGDVVSRAHATATLSAYRSAGVTHVGIIPEHVPPPLHGLSFRARDRAMIGDMTQIEIANLVGEEEARKIRQWRSGTRAASPEEKAEWRQLGIVGATEGEVETIGEIRPPLPTLIEKARKHWREQFTKLAKRHGTQGALQRVAAQLAAEAPRLTKVGGEFRKKLSAGTKEFVAQAKARGEATRALQAIVREDLYQRAAELSGYRKPSYGRPGPGSRVGREETPLPETIGRIEKAQARLEAVLGGGLVDVITAGDDRVCLVKFSQVTTIQGPRPIETIKIGDMVLTRRGWRRCTGIMVREYKGELIRIIIENAPALVCTANHPIWTERAGFIRADQVCCTDILQGLCDERINILAIENVGLAEASESPSKVLKRKVFSFVSAFVAVPISSINLDAKLFADNKIDDPAANLDLLHVRYTEAFERLPDGSFNTGLAVVSAKAGSRAKSGFAEINRGYAKFCAALSAQSQVFRSAAFLGTVGMVRPFATLFNLTKRLGTSLTRNAAALNMVLLAFPGTKIVAVGSSTLRDRKAVLASNTDFSDYVLPARVIASKRAEATVNLRARVGLAAEFARALCSGALAFIRALPRAINALKACLGVALERLTALVASKDEGHVLVYNLAIEGCHEYFANGILVHNCDECDDVADGGPYSLAEAEGLIPMHPSCRCAFAPAGKYEKDAVHDGDEPGHPFRGNQYTGGGEGSGMIAGVYFRGSVSQLEALQKARREGAGKAEIEKMVASFKSAAPAVAAPASSLYGWPPEKEAQYEKFLRGGSAGPEREGSKWLKEFSERFAKHGYRKDAAAIKEAAGVMFRVSSGYMLLMKRQDTGEWALPAGMLEENELPLHGAQREAAEETGFPGDVGAEKIDERVHNGLRFHTFLQPVAAKFEPILNSEHTDWGWFHLDDIPWPLHPGLAATLRKIDGEKSPLLK